MDLKLSSTKFLIYSLALLIGSSFGFSFKIHSYFGGEQEVLDQNEEIFYDEDNNNVEVLPAAVNILESPETIQEMIELILNKTSEKREGREEPELTLITFLQNAVKTYGQKKVAKSIYELAQKDMYDLIWMLAGDLDTYLIFDLYNAYSAAQSDPQVLSVYDRFRSGSVNRTIVPEVFAIDKRYDQYSWFRRVRGRMFINMERYFAGMLDINNGKTPPPIEYENGKVIIAGVQVPENKTFAPIRTTAAPYNYELDSDEDILDLLNFDR